MKRCPECGYRIRADVKLCPLCDTRMVEESSNPGARLHAQAHRKEGADCLLEKEATRQRQTAAHQRSHSGGSRGRQAVGLNQLATIVLIVLAAILTRACSA